MLNFDVILPVNVKRDFHVLSPLVLCRRGRAVYGELIKEHCFTASTMLHIRPLLGSALAGEPTTSASVSTSRNVQALRDLMLGLTAIGFPAASYLETSRECQLSAIGFIVIGGLLYHGIAGSVTACPSFTFICRTDASLLLDCSARE